MCLVPGGGCGASLGWPCPVHIPRARLLVPGTPGSQRKAQHHPGAGSRSSGSPGQDLPWGLWAAAGIARPAVPGSILLSPTSASTAGSRGPRATGAQPGAVRTWGPPGTARGPHPHPCWLWPLTWELGSFDGIPQRDSRLLASKASQSCKANSRRSPGALAQAATRPCERGVPAAPRVPGHGLGSP